MKFNSTCISQYRTRPHHPFYLIPTFFFFLFFCLLLSNIIPSLLINFNSFSSLKFSMAEKVTIMVLKVDLQCPCCYKKVKKILCKFPQIRDQIFNEKANTVTITVICCDPEKVRDKLCCKGAKVIKSIEIKEPEKPKLPEKPKEPEKPKLPEKPKEPEKPKLPEKPKEPEKPKLPQKPKEPEKPKDPPPPPPKTPDPDPFGGYVYPPVRTCCGPCSEGYGGGPCYFGLGVAAPPPPQPCFEGYYGYGYRERPCHVRCDYYFSEENPRACSIM